MTRRATNVSGPSRQPATHPRRRMPAGVEEPPTICTGIGRGDWIRSWRTTTHPTAFELDAVCGHNIDTQTQVDLPDPHAVRIREKSGLPLSDDDDPEAPTTFDRIAGRLLGTYDDGARIVAKIAHVYCLECQTEDDRYVESWLRLPCNLWYRIPGTRARILANGTITTAGSFRTRTEQTLCHNRPDRVMIACSNAITDLWQYYQIAVGAAAIQSLDAIAQFHRIRRAVRSWRRDVHEEAAAAAFAPVTSNPPPPPAQRSAFQLAPVSFALQAINAALRIGYASNAAAARSELSTLTTAILSAAEAEFGGEARLLDTHTGHLHEYFQHVYSIDVSGMSISEIRTAVGSSQPRTPTPYNIRPLNATNRKRPCRRVVIKKERRIEE